MLLFERVKRIARELSGSETKLAQKLSLTQKKFNYYMTANSEKNLWQHLPKILEIHPEINRDWLFFGEGEMLTPQGGWQPVAKPMTTAMAAGGPSEREAALERENAQLLRALLASKEDALGKANETIANQKETIAIQKQMLQQVRSPLISSENHAQAGGQRGAMDSPARGVRTSNNLP